MRLRSTRPPLIGPLASWELLRLARRGQFHRGRLLVVYFLLIAVLMVPVFWFPAADPLDLFLAPRGTLPTSEATKFNNRFVLVLVESILLAVAAMAPGYAAAAVADEKERGTLALLLTTALSDQEIVFGKATGRFGFVFAAATAGLPAVAALTVLGGVSFGLVISGFALVAGTAALATAIGVHAACITDDLRGAMMRAYGTTALVVGGTFIPPCVFLSPFGVLVLVAETNKWLAFALAGIGYPVLQLGIAAGFLIDATRRLRTGQMSFSPARPGPKGPPPIARPDEADEPWQKSESWSDRETDRALDSRSSVGASRATSAGWGPDTDDNVVSRPSVYAGISRTGLPPIGEMDALLWKERFLSGRPGGNDAGRVAIIGFGALGVLLFVIGAWILLSRIISPSKEPDEGGRLVMTAGTIFAGVYLFPVAIGLASAIARERRRQTLESLLALPVDRGAILRTKVRAVVERRWWWPILAVIAAGVSFGADAGWQLGIAAAGALAAGTGFIVSLGSWLTVRMPSETRAFRFLIPAVVLVVGLPVLVWNAMDLSIPLVPGLGMAALTVVFALGGIVLWRRAGRELDRR